MQSKIGSLIAEMKVGQGYLIETLANNIAITLESAKEIRKEIRMKAAQLGYLTKVDILELNEGVCHVKFVIDGHLK